MAIYKSSFNKKPEKKEKIEKQPKEPAVKIRKERKPVNKKMIACVVFSVLLLICIPNNIIKRFLLGVFGLSIYPVCVLGIIFSLFLMKKRNYSAKKKYLVYLISTLFIIWFIFHLILTSKLPVETYGEYLKQTYLFKTTSGGIVFSLISYPMVKYLGYVGAYIVCAIVLAIFVGLIVDYVSVERNLVKAEKKTTFSFDDIEELDIEQKQEETPLSKEEQAKKIAKRKLGLDKGESQIISSSMPTYDVNLESKKPLSKREYILTPFDPVIPPESSEEIFNPKTQIQNKVVKNNFDNAFVSIEELKTEKSTELNKIQESQNEPIDSYEEIHEVEDDLILEDDLSGYEMAFETDATVDVDKDECEDESMEISLPEDEEYEDLEDLSDSEEVSQIEEVEEIEVDVSKQEYVDEFAYLKVDDGLGSTVDTQVVRPSIDVSKFNLPNKITKPVAQEQEVEEEPKQKQEIPPYVAPPVDLLKYLDNPVRISDEELQDNIDRLEQVLEDFKVPAKVNNVQVGPAVTRYELTMPRGISVNKIAQMADDIAMTLASNGAIRVEAPIPGKNSVGIEVPNAQVSPVSLRELIDSDEFRQRGNPLSFVLGRDINGDIIFCNLDKMPHVLVAGSTGSGKSVCLNTMLLSMCYKAGPQDLRLILVDPKMVEFTTYNGLPHLLIPEVITGKDMTINALDWAIKEMERRYAMFAKNRVVNINEFNKSEMVKSKQLEKIPYIVIVVDELADLMLEAKREIDDRINKLAAKARAAGIHLVLATQRPSVDVITGTVKANLPSRIAFALTNYMDSKTILDGSGAEKLLGKGDMLFRPQDKPEPSRVQGAYVSNPEIYAVVEYIKEHNKPVYDDNAGRAIKNPKQDKTQTSEVNVENGTEFDPVLKEALKWFIQVKQASGSMISRRFSVGFNRAGRIMDQMEQAGFIGPQEGSKPRQVLISMDEYIAIFGED